MDGSSVNFAKLETKRKLHFGKVDKLFKVFSNVMGYYTAIQRNLTQLIHLMAYDYSIFQMNS